MLYLNQQPVTIQTFPDGTPKIEIPLNHYENHTNIIHWKYASDAEMIHLYYLVMHVRNQVPHAKLVLSMPYVPNARFDRVKDQSEVFTLKYFANFINQLQFDHVYTLDVHSNVSTALFHHITDKAPTPYIKQVLQVLYQFHDKKDIVLFFPDEGAMKRYTHIANEVDIPYVFGMKNRDWKSGQILGLEIINPNKLDLTNKNILIIDDICSKGGTFYHSAKKLQDFSPKNIYLYVSHCEDTIQKGELLNTDLIQLIFTTNSLLTIKHEKIKTFNV